MSKKDSPAPDLETLRHSASHVLAAAVMEMFPDAKLGIGPAIEGGFYYDFMLPRTLIPEDLVLIEKKMQHLIKQNLKFEKYEEPIDQAEEFLKKTEQILKVELVADLKKEGEQKVSFYKTGDFVDLCRGPHVESTKELKAVKLTHISGSYWRGDSDRVQLQRIYGVAFASKEELAKWEEQMREAAKRDHRELGKKLDLFSFHPEAPGAAFWHPRGKFVYDALLDFIKQENEKRGYQEIGTPIVLSSDLWHQSGHYENFKENMYFTEFEEREFAVKPMNCPGGCLLFAERAPSYRELPIKNAEFGIVHRLELSGVLHGLLRVREFRQDDAHVYCTPEQLEDEIVKIIEYTTDVYKHFGFDDYELFLATRPPKKAIGSEEVWERSTKALENAMKKLKLKWGVKEGEGAFYGPKIEFNVKDAIGRNWQLGTCQIDFNLPERFDLNYIAPDGAKHRPVMIHRAIIGSFERFLAVLIEHTSGDLPLDLQPEVARIVPVAGEFLEAAEKFARELKAKKVRIGVDRSADSLSKKIRNGELMKIPFLIIVGEKEAKSGKLTVRERGKKEQQSLALTELTKKLS
ncbi:MAG: threonine--tRNA ligase [Candidatus Peribacteraceae bacterium]|nr:threonine--tRNA ligase [Candidatus Peribacteraceae bacterium]